MDVAPTAVHLVLGMMVPVSKDTLLRGAMVPTKSLVDIEPWLEWDRPISSQDGSLAVPFLNRLSVSGDNLDQVCTHGTDMIRQQGAGLVELLRTQKMDQFAMFGHRLFHGRIARQLHACVAVAGLQQ